MDHLGVTMGHYCVCKEVTDNDLELTMEITDKERRNNGPLILCQSTGHCFSILQLGKLI